MSIIKLSNQDLIQTKLFINGEWVSGSTNQEFPVLDPSTNQELLKVSIANEDDYNNAIDIAYDTFQSFKKTNPRDRSNMLNKLYHSMINHKEDLAKILCHENGKPYNECIGEITSAASFFQWYAEEAPRMYGDVIQSGISNKKILTLRQPIGVVGILTPWNFPAAMITRKLGAALAAGCTSIIKPASATPLTASAIAYLGHTEAGIPKGVVNVLPTNSSSKIGKLVCEHPKIKKISFTGSTGVGKTLQSHAASTLKKASFELGGNAPFIVFQDADLDKALEGLKICKFRQSGQTCVCANRIFVHESIYDEFLSKALEIVKGFKLGKGYDSDTTHGPLINKAAVQKMDELVKDAVSKGAKIEIGGSPITQGPLSSGNFFQPTILTNLKENMDIWEEEIFGPIAPFIPFSSEEQVINWNNKIDVGLAGYYYTQDINKLFKISEDLEIGMIGINTGALSEAALPFGGVKKSGFGREGSKYGIEDYTVIKSLVLG
ncbi:Retinal dehydrogenase [Wickerhamomyces ciferrii]|uniref:Succinate-semialdehyde dehydrogenase, mitochondrial n=1 Tax=Wickerhamomyces ciferrii (strain ATCC 14091 / BCRC 22168 / CBS 111 / JCM 3599 / NBRC 0793 / NRRL Y-1031 F-60-10) TaxID=1206466 RepID=K0KW68_WICCF|nr:Retinal dehydrogenase [Wickerhamomyces ciferrii]CCH45739.1 Retinal dehydrogenase [Wickerhamomyces ciferrii]